MVNILGGHHVGTNIHRCQPYLEIAIYVLKSANGGLFYTPLYYPSEENVHSGLNRPRLIERKCEHWNWYHKSNLPKASPGLTQSTKHHTQKKSEGIQANLTKVASTRTQQTIMDNKISISKKCVDGLDEAAKGLMCATV